MTEQQGSFDRCIGKNGLMAKMNCDKTKMTFNKTKMTLNTTNLANTKVENDRLSFPDLNLQTALDVDYDENFQ